MQPKPAAGPKPSFLRRLFTWTKRLAYLLLTALVALLLYLWTDYDDPGFDHAAARQIYCTPPQPVVPGPGLPTDLRVRASNNNVDLAFHEGRTYMAFRTAPTHFASQKTRIVVLSSADRLTWNRETEIHMSADLREPRFLVYRGMLLLYFFKGGTDPLAFEPDNIHVVERKGDGAWTAPQPVYEPGFVVWRVREYNGRAIMSVYRGEGIYTTAPRPGEVRLLSSTDGYLWTPLTEAPQCTAIGAEEAEFMFDDQGNLVAVVRLEVSGAMVCTAPADNIGEWSCKYTPYKYDSSIMFRHDRDFYVIARRNVAGPHDRGMLWLPDSVERGWNLARYSLTRKRTCLYRVDVASKKLVPLFDFPSSGDTAFAGIVPLDARSYYVVNYSSPLEGPDWPWIGGQIFGTRLYEFTLVMPPPAPPAVP